VIRLKSFTAPGKHKFMIQVVDENDFEITNEKRTAYLHASREASRSTVSAHTPELAAAPLPHGGRLSPPAESVRQHVVQLAKIPVALMVYTTRAVLAAP